MRQGIKGHRATGLNYTSANFAALVSSIEFEG
jgi:hypothetical protein